MLLVHADVQCPTVGEGAGPSVDKRPQSGVRSVLASVLVHIGILTQNGSSIYTSRESLGTYYQ